MPETFGAPLFDTAGPDAFKRKVDEVARAVGSIQTAVDKLSSSFAGLQKAEQRLDALLAKAKAVSAALGGVGGSSGFGGMTANAGSSMRTVQRGSMPSMTGGAPNGGVQSGGGGGGGIVGTMATQPMASPVGPETSDTGTMTGGAPNGGFSMGRAAFAATVAAAGGSARYVAQTRNERQAYDLASNQLALQSQSTFGSYNKSRAAQTMLRGPGGYRATGFNDLADLSAGTTALVGIGGATLGTQTFANLQRQRDALAVVGNTGSAEAAQMTASFYGPGQFYRSMALGLRAPIGVGGQVQGNMFTFADQIARRTSMNGQNLTAAQIAAQSGPGGQLYANIMRATGGDEQATQAQLRYLQAQADYRAKHGGVGADVTTEAGRKALNLNDTEARAAQQRAEGGAFQRAPMEQGMAKAAQQFDAAVGRFEKAISGMPGYQGGGQAAGWGMGALGAMGGPLGGIGTLFGAGGGAGGIGGMLSKVGGAMSLAKLGSWGFNALRGLGGGAEGAAGEAGAVAEGGAATIGTIGGALAGAATIGTALYGPDFFRKHGPHLVKNPHDQGDIRPGHLIRHWFGHKKKKPQTGDSGQPAGGTGGQTYPQLEQMIKSLGDPFIVTATTNGQHATGSYHYKGEAVDIADAAGSHDTPGMLKLAQDIAAKYGTGLSELIYSGGPGVYIKDGKPTSASTYASVLAEHHNHVHVAASPDQLKKVGGLAMGGGNASTASTGGGGTGAAGGGSAVGGIGGGEGHDYHESLGGKLGSGGNVGSAQGGAGNGGQPGNTTANGGAGAPAPTGTLGQWIKQALGIAGIDTPGNEADVNIIASHESSGNPNAVNNTDSNARAGHPSRGIMQTTPSTFGAYALPGHGDINNPVDNIIAGSRYAISRYHSLDNVPGVMAVKAGRPYVGYDKGSYDIPFDQMAMLHKGEMVVRSADAQAARNRPQAGGGMSVILQFAPGSVVIQGAADEASAEQFVKHVRTAMEKDKKLARMGSE